MPVNRLLLLALVSTGTLVGGLGAIPAQASLEPGQQVPQGTMAATDPGPVPELATEYSNTVRNPDGSYTAEVSAGPVNYKDDSGDWTRIDNDLVPAPGDAYAVENQANDYTVSIPENPATTPVRFELDGDWVSMKLAGSDNVDPAVDGAEASFQDLTPAADEVVYEATDSGVKETIILDAAPTGPVSYVYNMKVSPGITPALTLLGMVEFRNANDVPQFVIPRGNMTDSAVPEPVFSGAVTYDLQQATEGWKFTITPDLGWLTDPARVYPVMIDPTVDKPVQKDCYLVQEAPTTSYCGQGILKVGATNSLYKRRALLDFNINGIPAGSTIHNANAWIWMDQYSTVGSGGATTYALYNPSSVWGGCASWNYTCTGGTWSGGGSQGQISSNAQSMGGTASGWQTWDITGRTAGWLNGSYENRGVLLRQTGENVKKVLGFVSSTHSNTGLRPLLRVNYTAPNTPPQNAQLQGITSCVSGCGDEFSVTNSATPTLRAIANDQDSGSLVYRFILRDWETGAELVSGQVGSAPGLQVGWPVPPGFVTPDGLYQWTVTVSDGSSTINVPGEGIFGHHVPQAPAPAAEPSIEPCADPICAGAAPVTTSTTPTLSALVQDTDSSFVEATFQVRPLGGTTPTFSGVESYVEVGDRAHYNLPPGILTDGQSYEFRVLSEAEGATSTAPWAAFEVDVPSGPPEPSQFTVEGSDCIGSCTVVFTPTPVIAAVVAAPTDGPVDLVFELWDGASLVSTHTTPNLNAGASTSWTVPDYLLASGEFLARVGARTGGITTWTTLHELDVALTGQSASLTDPVTSYERPAVEASDEFDATRTSDPALNGDEVNGTSTSSYANRGDEPAATDPEVRYAPILTIDKDDSSNPLSATNFINNSTLMWHHATVDYRRNCNDVTLVTAPSPASLGSTTDTTYSRRANTANSCAATGTRYWPWDKVKRETSSEGGPPYGQGMYLNLANDWRGGKEFTNQEPVYVRVKRSNGVLKWMHYWFNYGQSYFDLPVTGGTKYGYHEGDWEHMAIMFNSEERPVAVKYYYHHSSCYLPWYSTQIENPGAPKSGDRPLIDVAVDSHGSYPKGRGMMWMDERPAGEVYTWNGAANLKKLPTARGAYQSPVPWYGYRGSFGASLDYVSPTGPNPDREYTPDFSDDRCEN